MPHVDRKLERLGGLIRPRCIRCRRCLKAAPLDTSALRLRREDLDRENQAELPCDEANGRMTVDTEKSGSWEEPGETRDEVWTVLGT